MALCLDILSQTQVAIKISKNDGNGRLNALKELEYTKIVSIWFLVHKTNMFFFSLDKFKNFLSFFQSQLNSKDPQHNYFVHLIGDFESKSGHICLVFEKLELNL